MPTSSDKSGATGPEILFYHLERARLLDVLPSLLKKSLQRGWRVVVQGPNRKLVNDLNNDLWISRDDSFLPHGTSDDCFSSEQPIYLTENNDNPNGAAIRFYVAGAQPEEVEGYERIVYLFDGHNEDAVVNARKQWKRLVDEPGETTYWKQNERGSWEKKA